MVVGLIPSTKLTKAEREKIPKIRFDLAQEGITPEQWELSALDRGATILMAIRSLIMRFGRNNLVLNENPRINAFQRGFLQLYVFYFCAVNIHQFRYVIMDLLINSGEAKCSNLQMLFV